MKKIIFLVLLAITSWQHSFAQNFAYEGLNYDVTSATTVKVGINYGITGVVSIPAQVTYNSAVYTVTSIGVDAFFTCYGLTSVTIPNSVTSIGVFAFAYCFSLTSVTIPNSVTSIGADAFAICTSLTSVTIPNSVTSIGDYAFDNCTALTSVVCEIITPLSINPSVFQGVNQGTCSLTVPGGSAVSYVAALVWKDFAPITSPTENTTTDTACGSYDWANNNQTYTASGIYTGTTTNGVTELLVLTIFTTPTDQTNFSSGGLNYVVTSATTVAVGNNSFASGSISIPASVTNVCFDYSVTSIGDTAFRNCTGLTSVTIPNSVTSIGERAFSNCTGLTSVTIPNSVTNIGQYAFAFCFSLTSVTCLIVTPLSINSDVFEFLNQGACNLTVPNESVAAYQAAAVWQDFAPITCATPTENTTTVTSCGSYDWANNNQTYTESGTYTGTTTNCVTEKLVLTIISTPTDQTNFSSGGLNYVVTSATTVAVGTNSGASGSISIPASVSNACFDYTVTNIGDGAFYGCSDLTSVTIPNSVTSISFGAFAVCSGLTSVTIPNSVTSIGDSAFYGCSDLTSVTIPNSVTSIDDFAFAFCSGLTSVTIGNSVTSIGEYAFYSCSALTSVTIPNTVTSIGQNAFDSCSGLTSVTIPNSVTSISEGVFAYCSSLTSVTIPNSVTSIGEYAFYDCSSLTSVTCEMVTPLSINPSVFQGVNQGVCNLTVPNESVAAYQAAAVWQDFAPITCATPTENITTVTACPNYVWANNSQSYAASGTYTGTTTNCVTEKLVLTIISTPTDQTNFSSGGLNYVVTSATTVAVSTNSGASGSISIPASVSNACFDYTVTSIGDGAFGYCSGLTSVTIPNSVTSIGIQIFADCSGLTSVTIPNSVTSIGNYAFIGCSALTSVTIPNSVTSISEGVFAYCSSLTSVVCEIVTPLSINPSVFDGVNQGVCSLTVPNESVAAYAAAAVWQDFAPITCATPTENVTTVSTCDSYDWANNSQTYAASGTYTGTTTNCVTEKLVLTIISTPTDQTNFSSGGLNYVVTSATTVAVSTNSGASGSISIPASVSNGCFDYTVTSIGDGAFGYCSGLTSVTIPNSVTSIGIQIFAYCSGLTSVTIPNSVTSIGNYAFIGCSALTSVTIPNSVTSISEGVFAYCSSLTSVVCEIVTPLSINPSVFDGVNQGVCSLTVPNESVAAYAAAAVWQDFAPITCATPTENVTTVSTCDSYDWANNSQTYAASGTYTGTTTNCVTEKLVLTIISTPTDQTNFSSGGLNYVVTSATTVAVSTNSGASGSISIPASVSNGCFDYTVTSIGDGAFGYCSGLTSVTIPNSVTSIGIQIFAYCSGLTSVTIPNSVTSIGNYAFIGCSALTSVTIPNSVTSISEGVFAYCSSLTSVVCEIVTPLSINPSVFDGVNQGVCSLTVPNESVAAYQAAAVWQDFAPITCATPTENTTTVTSCGSYDWANNNQTYTASGTYTGTTTNCVTEKLVLTITTQLNYYLDADSDGYYTGSSVSSCTSPGAGYTLTVTGGGDCDDTKAAIHPGAVDICYDGIDNDCDGIVDNGCVPLITEVQPLQWGVTLNRIDDYIYANLVAGAQGYRFKVTNLVTSEEQSIDRYLRVFRITQLPNYAFNTEYQVEVMVRKNNVWQPNYGNARTLKTPTATTQLINCGASLTAMTDIIYANSVQYATGYQFKVTNVLNPTDTRTINRSLREFRMSLLSGIQYNTTYSVEVAVRNTDGVTYLPYGPVCEVTTPNFPASYLQDSQCDDYLVPSNATILYAQSFTGAEGYRFRLENLGLGYEQAVDRALRTVRLSDFTGLTPGSTYAVKVALKINGVWGSYTGKGCSIIIPGGAPARIDEETVVVKGNFAAVAYPNPFASTFAIQVKTSSQEVVQLKVYDMIGRLVERRETNVDAKDNVAFGERYPSGVYSVVVTQGDITETLRVIKR